MKDVLAGDVDIEPPDDVAVPIDELHRTVGADGEHSRVQPFAFGDRSQQ